MPFAPDVFRHCPGLEGRIQDPETSRFRDMEARIAELDAQGLPGTETLEAVKGYIAECEADLG